MVTYYASFSTLDQDSSKLRRGTMLFLTQMLETAFWRRGLYVGVAHIQSTRKVILRRTGKKRSHAKLHPPHQFG